MKNATSDERKLRLEARTIRQLTEADSKEVHAGASDIHSGAATCTVARTTDCTVGYPC
ncbi:MAG: hypothetical protein KC591_07570 [Gemmatimonadetes bacterium]|nr:hypothetical protein [Gemmatimonadota bacterium]